MQSIIELVLRAENIQARISELEKQKYEIHSIQYTNRMNTLIKEHQLIVKMLLNKIGGIYFKDCDFTIDNFDLVEKD